MPEKGLFLQDFMFYRIKKDAGGVLLILMACEIYRSFCFLWDGSLIRG